MQIPMGNKRKGSTAAEKKLLAQFAQLSDGQRDSLLAFAEFLAAQTSNVPAEPVPPAEPRHVPRPAEESVVAAIKRLNATYFMLEDRSGLLNETSVLMTQHVMQGREIGEVIDELESVFRRFYDEWLSEQQT